MPRFPGDLLGGGPAVRYQLPRPLTVPSSVDLRQRQRVASIVQDVRIAYFAAPSVSESVYQHGTITNTSPFHLLAGAVSIFMDGSYVGPTAIYVTDMDKSVDFWTRLGGSVMDRVEMGDYMEITQMRGLPSAVKSRR